MSDADGDSRYHLPPHKDGKPKVLTAARKARGDVVTVESDRGGVERRSLAAPLDWYVARQYISGKQYRAGNRLHNLWRGSVLALQYGRYSTMRFGETPSGFDIELLPFMPRDYANAMNAISSFQAQRIVRQVCCFEVPAGTGSGIILLRDGLDDLVRHFRL